MAKQADFDGIDWGNKVELTYTPEKTEENPNPEPVTKTVVFRQIRHDVLIDGNEDTPDTTSPMIVRWSEPRGRKRTHTPLKSVISVTNLTPPKAEKGSGDGASGEGTPEPAGAPA